MDWKFDYRELVNKVKYQLQLGCQIDLDWTLFRGLLLVRILNYAVQGQKRQPTSKSDAPILELATWNLAVSDDYKEYTRHKNIRKQPTFKLATSMMK